MLITPIGKKRKSILLKLNSSRVKNDIFANIKSASPGGLYASDSLTNKRSKIYYDLRQLKKSDAENISTRIRKGTPFAKFKNNEWTSICNDMDFNNFTHFLEMER